MNIKRKPHHKVNKNSSQNCCFSWVNKQALNNPAEKLHLNKTWLNLMIYYLIHRFEEAISSQPIAVAMCMDHVRLCGTLLIVIGTVLVLSSTWSLGITGTFLGLLTYYSQSHFP